MSIIYAAPAALSTTAVCRYVATSLVVTADLSSATLNGKLDLAGNTTQIADRALFPLAGTSALLGIYVWSGSAWAIDPANEAPFHEGAKVDVIRGTSGATQWRQTAASGTPVFSLVTSGGGGIAANDPRIYYSPENCYIGGATNVLLRVPGAFARVTFTGTAIKVLLSVARFVSNGTLAENYPTIRYQVDGGAFSANAKLTSTTTSIAITGLSPGLHTLRFELDSTYGVDDSWNTPVSSLQITGYQLDSGGAVVYQAVTAPRMRVDGDSIVAGVNTEGIGDPSGTVAPWYPDTNRASHTWPRLVADALGYDCAQLGYGGAGWFAAGIGNVPSVLESMDFYYGSVDRKRFTGKLADPPTIVVAALGVNDHSGDVSPAVFQYMQRQRSECGSDTYIVILVPPSGAQRANITTGFGLYTTAHPTDERVLLVDLGVGFTAETTDGTHYSAAGHVTVASALTPILQNMLPATRVQDWDPGQSSLVTLDGNGRISSIASAIGTTIATQATAGKRPLLVTGPHPAIRTTQATAENLALSAHPNLAGPGTVILILRHNSDEGMVASVFFSNDLVFYVRLAASNTWGVIAFQGVNTQYSSGQTVGLVPKMLTLRANNATDFWMYTNGGHAVHTTVATSWPNNGLSQIGNSAAAANVDILRVVAFDHYLSDSELLRAHSELAKKYGIILEA